VTSINQNFLNDLYRGFFRYHFSMERRVNSIDLKLVVLGSASVGKTCLINRYCNGRFPENVLSTIGAGFFTHSLELSGTEVTVMIWDTAGEERFRSVAPSLLRGANGLILVYDTQNMLTFEDLDLYMEMFLDVVNVNGMSVTPVLLLGNKIDLPNPVVSPQAVEDWKLKNRVQFSYHVSAKTGLNVECAFDELVKCLVTPENFAVDRPALQLILPRTEKAKEGCC
jgi:small GTP-binding protein